MAQPAIGIDKPKNRDLLEENAKDASRHPDVAPLEFVHYFVDWLSRL